MEGLIYWAIVTVVLSVLGFLCYKFLLRDSVKFGRRKNVVAWGMAVIVMTFSAFLFLPLVLLNSKSVTESVVFKIQENIVSETHSKINVKSEIENALDKFLNDAKIEKDEDVNSALKSSIDYAVKESSKKSKDGSEKNLCEVLKISVDRFNQLVKAIKESKAKSNESNQIATENPVVEEIYVPKIEVSDSDIENYVAGIYEPNVKESKETAIKDNKVKNLFSKAVDDVSSVLGKYVKFPSNNSTSDSTDKLRKVEDVIKKILPTFFLLIGLVLSGVVLIFVFWMIFLVGEKKKKIEKEDDRKDLFEFDRNKKISELVQGNQ